MFSQIIIASIIGSIFALIGGVILLIKEKLARKISLFLVSFAVGALFGAAFFDLLPEALESIEARQVFLFVIFGILTLFLFEKFLKWQHCHDREVCEFHPFSKSVIFGDVIHNFVDGIIIALSFSLDSTTGIVTTAAIFFHEVPQEIGDFGALLHAGYSKTKVLFYNIFTALATPLGALVGYFALPSISLILPQLISFAAGIFIYIAAADLIPELRHKTRGSDFTHFLMITVGLGIIWLLHFLE